MATSEARIPTVDWRLMRFPVGEVDIAGQRCRVFQAVMNRQQVAVDGDDTAFRPGRMGMLLMVELPDGFLQSDWLRAVSAAAGDAPQ